MEKETNKALSPACPGCHGLMSTEFEGQKVKPYCDNVNCWKSPMYGG